LYLEAPREHTIDFSGFEVLKEKPTGEVFYALLARGA